MNSDKLNNIQPSKRKDKVGYVVDALPFLSLLPSLTCCLQDGADLAEPNTMSGMEDILSRLKLNDARKSTPSAEAKAPKPDFGTFDKLLNNLQDQNKTLKNQEKELKNEAEAENHKDVDHPASSSVCPPASDHFGTIKSGSQATGAAKVDVAEMMRVKQELEAAKSVISRQEQELAETRTLKQTMDQAMGPPSEVDFGAPIDISEQTIGHLQSAFNASARPFTSRNDAWVTQEEPRPDQVDVLGGTNYGRGRGIWNNPSASMTNLLAPAQATGYNNPRDARLSGQAYNGVYGAALSPADGTFQQRNFSGPAAPLGYDVRQNNDIMQYNPSVGMRRNGGQLRINPTLTDPLAQFSSFPPVASALTPPPISPMGLSSQYNYQRGLATPMTPAATDFTSSTVQGAASPWSLPVSISPHPAKTLLTLPGWWSKWTNLCHTP